MFSNWVLLSSPFSNKYSHSSSSVQKSIEIMFVNILFSNKLNPKLSISLFEKLVLKFPLVIM